MNTQPNFTPAVCLIKSLCPSETKDHGLQCRFDYFDFLDRLEAVLLDKQAQVGTGINVRVKITEGHLGVGPGHPWAVVDDGRDEWITGAFMLFGLDGGLAGKLRRKFAEWPTAMDKVCLTTRLTVTVRYPKPVYVDFMLPTYEQGNTNGFLSEIDKTFRQLQSHLGAISISDVGSKPQYDLPGF